MERSTCGPGPIPFSVAVVDFVLFYFVHLLSFLPPSLPLHLSVPSLKQKKNIIFTHCFILYKALSSSMWVFMLYFSSRNNGTFLAGWFSASLNWPLESVRINRSQWGWPVFDLKLETQQSEASFIYLGVWEPWVLIYEGAQWKHMKVEVIFINSFL